MKFDPNDEVTEVEFSPEKGQPFYRAIRSLINSYPSLYPFNCQGRSQFFGASVSTYSGIQSVYEVVNGKYRSLPQLKHRRYFPSVCYVNRQLIVLGGDTNYGKSQATFETLRVDELDTDTEWKLSKNTLPSELDSGPSAVSHEGKIFLTGGRDELDLNASSSAWEGKISSDNTISWNKKASMNYRRSNHFSFSIPGKVVVLGGIEDCFKKDRVELFDGEKWVLGPEVPFRLSARRNACVLDRQGRIIIFLMFAALCPVIEIVMFNMEQLTFKRCQYFVEPIKFPPHDIFSAMLE